MPRQPSSFFQAIAGEDAEPNTERQGRDDETKAHEQQHSLENNGFAQVRGPAAAGNCHRYEQELRAAESRDTNNNAIADDSQLKSLLDGGRSGPTLHLRLSSFELSGIVVTMYMTSVLSSTA